MSLPTLPTVRKLQEALHAKAKSSPNCRFHTLHDKISRTDVLWDAYRRCLINGGAAGVDGIQFQDIEAYGRMRWLAELAEELQRKTYRPQAVRRVYIPKPNGKQRPLGIPTVKDRVVQMAAHLVLGPIFEADLQPEQYAYRPERSAIDAVRHVLKLLDTGHREVVDADLSGYFDTIPHAELMKSVARRISDGQMLCLIKMWLIVPVEEFDKRGRKQRTTRNRDEGRGCPQGAPISPLLANLYMRRFILGWKTLRHAERLQAHIVNYADDFVICCRRTAEPALDAMQDMMGRLKLTVNETKTQVCRVAETSFDFLGYRIGKCYSPRKGTAYMGARPSPKSIQRVCQAISARTGRDRVFLEVSECVASLNQVLVGWGNYFDFGSVKGAYRIVDAHTRYRLRQWLRRKHGLPTAGQARFPAQILYDKLGLVRLEKRTRRLSWANA